MPDKRLIDANALNQRFTAMQECANMRDHVYLMGVLSVIDNAPTIDAVPVVHRRWEKVQVWKDNPQTTLRCSLCKTNQPIYEHDEWKFCPFCGQPMDGGAEV